MNFARSAALQRSLCVCGFLLCPSLRVLRKEMAEVTVKTSLSRSFSIVSFADTSDHRRCVTDLGAKQV